MNSTHEIQGQADLPDPLLRVYILSSKACKISGVVHIVYVFSSDLLRVFLDDQVYLCSAGSLWASSKPVKDPLKNKKKVKRQQLVGKNLHLH